MINVSQTFMWMGCKLSIKHIQDHHVLKTYSNLIKLKDKQQAYASGFEIPHFNIVPTITQFASINEGQSQNRILDIYERFWIFEFGVICLEIQFRMNVNELTLRSLNQELKINGKTTLSRAIWLKGIIHSNISCLECESTNIIRGPTYLKTYGNLALNNVKSQLNDYNSINVANVVILTNKVSYLIPKNGGKNVYEHVYISIIAISLIFQTINQFGRSIYDNSKNLLPKFRTKENASEFDDIQTKFINIFFYRFFWTSQEFLTQSSGPMQIPTIEWVLVRQISKFYEKETVSTIKMEDVQSLTSLPIPTFLELYEHIRKVPGNIFNNFFNHLSTVRLIPTGSLGALQNLTEIEDQIVTIILEETAQELKKRKSSNDFNLDKTIGLFTTNRIVKLLDMSPGEGNRKILSTLNGLVDKQVLVKLTKADGVKKGRGEEFYRLNPTTPFATLLLSHYYN